MAIDRESALRQAEKLYRQGKLAAAIAEYVRLVEDQPRDWNAINALGDLYLRAGDAERAVSQFVHIADHLFSEGFFPKAAAVYKKALKVRPQHEHTLLRLSEIAAAQELLVDARAYLRQLWKLRTERDDDRGAAECLVRLAQLPEADADAKLTGARASKAVGDTQRAVTLFREAAEQLEQDGRLPAAVEALTQVAELTPEDRELRQRIGAHYLAIGEPDHAASFLDAESAAVNPDLLLALARTQLEKDEDAAARTSLTRLMMMAPERAADVLRLAGECGRAGAVARAFLCADVVVDDAILQGDWDRAIAVLDGFLEHVSYVPALQRLVDVAREAHRGDLVRRARERLADAHLGDGDGEAAQTILESMLHDDPDSAGTLERLRRAFELIGAAGIDEALSRIQSRARDEARRTSAPVDAAPDLSLEAAAVPELVDETRVELAAPHAGDDVLPGAGGQAAEAGSEDHASAPGAIEIDLSEALAGLSAMAPPVPVSSKPPAQPHAPVDLDSVFEAMRPRGAEYHSVAEAAALYERGLQRLENGDFSAAAADLAGAAHVPAFRFGAAARLGREYLVRQQHDAGIEWLERAAAMPAPSREEALAVLYDLAGALERIGEPARALAVLMEIDAEDRGYRDVAPRIAVLTRAVDAPGA